MLGWSIMPNVNIVRNYEEIKEMTHTDYVKKSSESSKSQITAEVYLSFSQILSHVEVCKSQRQI